MKALEDLEAAYAAATPHPHVYAESANNDELPWRVDAERPTGEDEVIAFFKTEDEAILHCLMHNALPALIECAKRLREAQEALDVLAEDASEAGFPGRAEDAATLAMECRAALAKLKEAK